MKVTDRILDSISKLSTKDIEIEITVSYACCEIALTDLTQFRHQYNFEITTIRTVHAHWGVDALYTTF